VTILGSPRLNVHATGLLLDGRGVLLRGPSGAGKSLLALELLDRQALFGRPGLLLADDRVDPGQRWRLALEPHPELLHARAQTLDLDHDTRAVVRDRAGQSESPGQRVDERAEADALNHPGHPEPESGTRLSHHRSRRLGARSARR